MSDFKRKKYESDKKIKGRQPLLPTPDKSADPPQPQGKTVTGDFPSANKHNSY